MQRDDGESILESYVLDIMFEHKSQPLLSKRAFAWRITTSFILTIVIVGLSVFLGMAGHREVYGMTWPESFYQTCRILSGHDVIHEVPQQEEPTMWGHIFSGTFGLYARLVFVSMIAILTIPILHRILHKFHLDLNDLSDEG